MKLTHLKNIIIEKHHHDAGYVEGAQGRVNNVVLAIKQAFIEVSIGRIVQTQDNGRPYGGGDQPHENNGEPHAFVVLVLRIFYWLSYCYVPV